MSSDVSAREVRCDDVAVSTVLEPEAVDDLCVALASLRRDGARAVITGGGTRLAFGNLGGPFDVAISTAKLNRVLRYEPDDLMLSVEAGCTVGHIDATLAAHGQMMALDVAHPEMATIGGSYACGMSGPRRLGGGSLKDWAVGIEVAGPDGVIARAGGNVVKNVTGYDMMHVHYGALGAFGVVTRLNLKVFPVPGPPRAVVMVFDTPAEAHAAAAALLRSALQPSSLLISNDDGWRLSVRCDAPAAASARQVERVIEAARSAASPASQSIHDNADIAVAPFISVTDLQAGRGVARLSVPASRQSETLDRLSSRRNQLLCADLGSGLVYVAGVPDPDWIAWLGAIVPRPVFLALPAHLKSDLDVFGGIDPPGSAVVRRLKQAFDPMGQINRGRFALGL